jgi:hypothetical protein
MSLQQLRLIVHALMAGVTIFAGIAAWAGPVGAVEDERLRWIFLGIAVLLGGNLFFAWGAVRKKLLAPLLADLEGARAPIGSGSVPAPLQSTTIVAGAMAVGVGLLGCVGLLLTGYLPLLVVPVVAVGVLTQILPTRERLEAALERARREAV